MILEESQLEIKELEEKLDSLKLEGCLLETEVKTLREEYTEKESLLNKLLGLFKEVSYRSKELKVKKKRLLNNKFFLTENLKILKCFNELGIKRESFERKFY